MQSDPAPLNYNLVEISDWLTKIIVGVGLVELHSIPRELGRLAYYLGPGLQPRGCDGPGPCGDVVSSGQEAGLAIVVFYFALGFMLGYVWAMVYFADDLARKAATLERDNEALLGAVQRDKQRLELIMAAEESMNGGDLGRALEYMDEALKKQSTRRSGGDD